MWCWRRRRNLGDLAGIEAFIPVAALLFCSDRRSVKATQLDMRLLCWLLIQLETNKLLSFLHAVFQALVFLFYLRALCFHGLDRNVAPHLALGALRVDINILDQQEQSKPVGWDCPQFSSFVKCSTRGAKPWLFFWILVNMFACTFDSGMTFLLLDLLSRMGNRKTLSGHQFFRPSIRLCLFVLPLSTVNVKCQQLGIPAYPRYVVLQFLAKRQELWHPDVSMSAAEHPNSPYHVSLRSQVEEWPLATWDIQSWTRILMWHFWWAVCFWVVSVFYIFAGASGCSTKCVCLCKCVTWVLLSWGEVFPRSIHVGTGLSIDPWLPAVILLRSSCSFWLGDLSIIKSGTGDLGIQRADGTILFKGRKDRQVKFQSWQRLLLFSRTVVSESPNLSC